MFLVFLLLLVRLLLDFSLSHAGHLCAYHANSWKQLGLAAVPFLPFIFDKPVEQAVEWGFHKGFETIWGPEAVRHSPVTGRIEELQTDNRKASGKEKEL